MDWLTVFGIHRLGVINTKVCSQNLLKRGSLSTFVMQLTKHNISCETPLAFFFQTPNYCVWILFSCKMLNLSHAINLAWLSTDTVVWGRRVSSGSGWREDSIITNYKASSIKMTVLLDTVLKYPPDGVHPRHRFIPGSLPIHTSTPTPTLSLPVVLAARGREWWDK